MKGPDYYDPAHERWFSSTLEVVRHYDQVVDIHELATFTREEARWWLLRGTRK